MPYVLAAVLIWSALGLLACVGFRRAGHNFWLYAGLGIWMGPFILVVMRLVAQEQEPSKTVLLRDGTPLDGWLDLLVGIDGSVESSSSVIAAVETLRPAVRRISFVAVLDHETASSPDFFDTDEELERMLHATANRLDLPNAALALLSGRADRALLAYAAEESFDLLLVSHRRLRSASVLLGSTVRRLSNTATVPVLVGPPADTDLITIASSTAASTGE